MSDTLHKMQVIIEGHNAKLKQVARESIQEIAKMTNSINSELKKTKNPMSSLENDGAMKQVRKMQDSIRNYVKEAQLAAGIKVYTDDYLKLQKDIANTEKTISKLKEKMRGMDESKRFVPTQEFTDLEKNIKSAENACERLIEKRRKLVDSGKASFMTDEYQEVTAHLNEAQGRLEDLISKQKEWQSLGFSANGSSVMKDLSDEIQETTMEIEYLQGELQDLKNSGQDPGTNSDNLCKT